MDQLEETPAIPLPPPKPVNKQLYENSSLAGSEVEAKAMSGQDSFFNAKKPNLAIEHEKPEHRAILLLKARGWTNSEIAKYTGYTDAWVSQITRQPWFQVALIKLLNECGKEPLKDFLGAQLEPTLIRLIQLRDQNISLPVAMAATSDLLNRYLGKPVSRTEMTIHSVKTTEEQFTDIDEELKRLADEEKHLLSSREFHEAEGPSASNGGGAAELSPGSVEAGAPTILVSENLEGLKLAAPQVQLN